MIGAFLAAAVALAPVDAAATGFFGKNDAGALLSAVTLVLDAGTARQTGAQNGVAALAAQTVLATPVDGEPLAQRVADDGGSVDIAVGPTAVRFVVDALPAALPKVAADVARALAAPDTSTATLATARTALLASIDDEEKNPSAVGLAMVRGSYYRGGASRPLLGTRESLAALGPADVAAFVRAHYVRGNAFATATGVVDASTEAAARSLVAALPAGTEAPAAIPVVPLPNEPKRVVTHRDVGVPFVMLGFPAPALADGDFAAMLVLRAILSDIADRSDVSTAAPIERGLDIVYSYDVRPATMAVAINGALLDPSAGLTIVQAIAKNAVQRPFSTTVIRRYKDTARGQWALEALSLDDRAWQIGAAVAQHAAPDRAAAIASAIDRVTPADVQRVAKRYLQHFVVALVLPRSAH